ncbi:MAG: RHS repeat-associated core domain-containing protein [bacterium]
MRICRIDNSGHIFYYINDPLGSPVGIMNEQYKVAQRYHFGEFGEKEASKGTANNDYLFTGKKLDRSGLYYFGARYYDYSIGRFISPDPKGISTIPELSYDLKNSQPLNLYAYCLNNPLRYFDC